MAFVETANITRSRSLSLQGFLFTLALIVMSLVDIRFAGLNLSFMWLPLIGVFLWPRGAETSSSAGLLLIAGLLFDIISDGAIGVWPIIFLVTLLILRPNKRSRNVTFISLWTGFFIWASALLLAICAVQLVFMKVPFSILDLVTQWLPTLLIFPAVFWVARTSRQIFTDPSERPFL